jgi:hypothetical protein
VLSGIVNIHVSQDKAEPLSQRFGFFMSAIFVRQNLLANAGKVNILKI